MTNRACFLLAVSLSLATPGLAQTADSARAPSAVALLDRAIDAMGGDRLAGLTAVRATGVEHTNMLEQSERPEGPYLVSYVDFVETRDLSGERLRSVRSARSIVQPRGTDITSVVAAGAAALRFGERWVPGSADMVAEAEDSLQLGPERVLLAARSAADLRHLPDAKVQGVEHRVVAFTLGERQVALHLNAHTFLPTAVQWTRDYPGGFFLSVWGDITMRVEYSLWHLEPGGLMYPRQWTTSLNGLPYRDRTILQLELDAAVDELPMELQPEIREGFEARRDRAPDRIVLGRDFGDAVNTGVEIVPGIVQIAGTWNVTLIEQPDGIMVLEAPISSAYSAQVLDELGTRYPDRPVTALITTSDAWPHIGGVREYAARGIPIRAFAPTLPLLERLIAAPRSARPDRLAMHPMAPRFEPVAERTEIGEGPGRMVILPIRGEGGERMLAVWFPEHRLLYASDLVQHGGPDGEFFMPSYLAEVEALVKREQLAVETVFAMHLGPTPWRDVAEALAQRRAGQ